VGSSTRSRDELYSFDRVNTLNVEVQHRHSGYSQHIAITQHLEMPTPAEIIAELNRLDQTIRQSLRNGTVLAVMKKEKKAMVSGSALSVT
jgi:hypothetical protein